MLRASAEIARVAVLTLSLTLLSGCATRSLTPPERSYTGRFSVTTVQGEQRDSVSGRFNLELRGSQQILELASPLGTTVARIEVEPGGARATGAQLREVRGPDADALTEQLLGWRLPVSGFADWIEGRPMPDRAARVERDAEHVVLIEQEGWTIRLPEYFTSTARPRRVLLERAAAGNAPAVTLRLVVDDPAG